MTKFSVAAVPPRTTHAAPRSASTRNRPARKLAYSAHAHSHSRKEGFMSLLFAQPPCSAKKLPSTSWICTHAQLFIEAIRMTSPFARRDRTRSSRQRPHDWLPPGPLPAPARPHARRAAPRAPPRAATPATPLSGTPYPGAQPGHLAARRGTCVPSPLEQPRGPRSTPFHAATRMVGCAEEALRGRWNHAPSRPRRARAGNACFTSPHVGDTRSAGQGRGQRAEAPFPITDHPHGHE